MTRQLCLRISLATLLLTACATTPKMDTTGIDLSVTPQRAVAEAQALQGAPLLWGGVIINSANLKDTTQLEILAYPLQSDQRPDTDQTPLGRFIAQQDGYLEISDYAQGRLVTVKGTLLPSRAGRIGETEYTYPVLHATQLHLWPKRGSAPETRVQFGIGVLFHD
ncbi:MAG: Slp family lipoprotein [Pseudomonadota bacterium]